MRINLINFENTFIFIFIQNDIKDGIGVFARPGESKAIVLSQKDNNAGTKFDLKCCGGLKISRE